MSSPVDDDFPEFGVLVVAGFAEQRPGTAIASFAGALYSWLFRWNARPCSWSVSPPALSGTVLSGAGADDEPAHARLTLPAQLSGVNSDDRWLLAESSWADLYTPPRFLGIARWIWKISTCLLVLQFVIPMRRHWRRARRDSKSGRRRLADRLIAVCYLALIAVAAMASVLLSLLLLALAVVEKLPIPRIDKAVHWIAIRISSVLGDSYMLAHCPVQFAAMRTKVDRDLRWLSDRCENIAIVAHSQGAAIAHQVLKDGGDHHRKVRAFITVGQGITKLHLLQRMDWDPQVYRAAWWSRLLVTAGMFLAGLPALSLLARRWTGAPVFRDLASLPLSVLLPGAGFAITTIGVRVAMRATGGHLEQDLALPDAEFCWSDYYASADPVANGPLAAEAGSVPVAGLLPRSCNQVYNSGSVLFDHNRYLRNQDQLVSRLINDLTAAAGNGGLARPQVVRDEDLILVGQRRHRLVMWLVAARIVTVGLVIALWKVNLGPLLKAPMTWLIDRLAPKAGMGDGFARFLAAVLVTAVVYLALVIAWRIRERYVERRFFHSAVRIGDIAPPVRKPAGRLRPAATTVPETAANGARLLVRGGG